ncbi:hypothetical protein [uncultured Photobacterium sp.]|nr:hypothetical protein [uncultured Photobacterium sp.]
MAKGVGVGAFQDEMPPFASKCELTDEEGNSSVEFFERDLASYPGDI